MNYSKKAVDNRLKKNNSNGVKYLNKAVLIFLRALLIACLIAIVLMVSAGIGLFMGVVDNTPQVNIESIVPMGYQTSIYDSAGNLTDTLVMEGSNRQEVTWEELPECLINAFVAIEDSRFWEHKGIDTRAIFRAVKGVLTKDSSSGGGSTITQQLIKNNVFEGGHESSFGAKLERKIQEQYLAMELEKVMDKKLILTNYLNTINLGNNSLGVKVAAKRYFDKNVSDLTLSEATVIAGITQNPSKLNPISGREKNAEKREIILKYMYEQGYITKAEWDEALADPVYDRIQNVDIVTKETTSKTYSYFTDELIAQIIDTIKEKFDYSDTQAHNLLYSGGLTVYTTQDPALQAIVDEEVNNPDNYVSSKYGYEYRLSLQDPSGEKTHYNQESYKTWCSESGVTYHKLFETEEAAKEALDKYKSSLLESHPGYKVVGESLNCTLEPQVSFVLMDQSNGSVKAISGGRGNKKVSLSLNRATGTLRQPGSTFKVLSAFAPAIDACGATLATVYYDEPYTIGNKTFKNWYSSGYYGWCNIRDGIIYSMNIIAVRCLMETVSPELGVEYCKRFGITSLTDTDYNPATALGGLTYGVSNLELTGAYASIANGGLYTKPRFFTKILDHDGQVLIDNTPEQTRVLKETSAFLLTDAMKDSMIGHTIYCGSGGISATSPAAHLDSMSCAGKSGTTTNNYDIWFAGYTPYYTGVIWAGYDNNEETLSGQTSFHKQIWKKIMNRVHDGLSDPGFTVPEGIVKKTVCRKSGLIATDICQQDPRGSALYTEYFAEGTEPTSTCHNHTRDEIGTIHIRTPEGSYTTTDDTFEWYVPEETVIIGPDGIPINIFDIDNVITGIDGGPGVIQKPEAETMDESPESQKTNVNGGPGTTDDQSFIPNGPGSFSGNRPGGGPGSMNRPQSTIPDTVVTGDFPFLER